MHTFSTVGLGTGTNKLVGQYPYFIGNTYRSPFIVENQTLNQEFDFNNSGLRRNTLPYNVDEKFAGNDFVIESYEQIRQISKIEAVTEGGVDGITILNGGDGYKVGDLTEFDDTGTNGSGFRAEVDEIVGIGISSINTNLTSFENVVFEWKSGSEVVANYLPFIELNDKDAVSVSGLSSSIVNLTDSFNVGVKTDRVGLAKTMTIGAAGGLIQDIFVTKIPNTVAIGGSLRVGSGNVIRCDIESLRVLNVYPLRKVIRVLRHTGIAHTLGSNIDVLNNQISIPVKTTEI